MNTDRQAAEVPPVLYTVPETARALRLSTRSVFRLIQRGELPVVRVGRALRLDPRDLAEFVERQKSGAPEGATP